MIGMAKSTAMNLEKSTDVFEMSDDKGNRETEKVVTVENTVVAEQRNLGDGAGAVSDPLAHLPEHFRKEIEAQATVISRKVSLMVMNESRDEANLQELFRFAGSREKLLMVVGTLMAIGSGAAFPLMIVIFGSVLLRSSSTHAQQLITAFTDLAHVNAQGQPDPLISPDAFQAKVNTLALDFVYLFIAAFAATYVKNACWYFLQRESLNGFRMLSGARIARSVRQAYLKVHRKLEIPSANREAILRQNIAYFDKLGAGEVTTRVSTDTNLLQGQLPFIWPLNLRWYFRKGCIDDTRYCHVLHCFHNCICQAMEDDVGPYVHYTSTWPPSCHNNHHFAEA
jgi:hypothetical protein